MILAFSGGVGGAKLVQGLAAHVPADQLTVVVNTADDFEHLGLYIAPDVDTVMYTLAGLASQERGWGLAGETWNALQMLGRYGVETWFQLGDRDLGTHILRTRALCQGCSLSEITAELCRRLDVGPRVIPMTDDRVTTYIETPDGLLHFQEYFVRERCESQVLGVQIRGLEAATPSLPFRQALAEADAVILTPSNPVVSLGPILGLPGVQDALRTSHATRIAVTPLIGGQAVKGPTVPLMQAVGWTPTAAGVAHLYAEFLDFFVLDVRDETLRPEIEALGLTVHVTDTLMTDATDKARLAGEILSLL
jgi:LPPG:FO 2-phospho-L-lactate transferase